MLFLPWRCVRLFSLLLYFFWIVSIPANWVLTTFSIWAHSFWSASCWPCGRSSWLSSALQAWSLWSNWSLRTCRFANPITQSSFWAFWSSLQELSFAFKVWHSFSIQFSKWLIAAQRISTRYCHSIWARFTAESVLTPRVFPSLSDPPVCLFLYGALPLMTWPTQWHVGQLLLIDIAMHWNGVCIWTGNEWEVCL